jgi:hypothetical protein
MMTSRLVSKCVCYWDLTSKSDKCTFKDPFFTRVVNGEVFCYDERNENCACLLALCTGPMY